MPVDLNQVFEELTPARPQRLGAELTRATGFVVTLRLEARDVIVPIRSERSGPVVVGTAPGADVSVPGAPLAPFHASLSLDAKGLRVRALNPSAPCWVAGLRVLEAVLSGGEALALGEVPVDVARIGRPPATAPAREVEPSRFGALQGSSVPMRRLYAVLARLSRCDVSVVIEGETGTGKEVAANALHTEGIRRAGPFVVFDCAGVSRPLAEAALFGDERGASTDAQDLCHGVFEQAQGGTILLDELGELPLPLQAKLLRVVERRHVRRLGATRATLVDVRILAATRRDLSREVREGRFLEALYHRLAIARVRIPSLRERPGDVAGLVRGFCALAGAPEDTFSRTQIEGLRARSWPGNVRELRAAVHRYLAFGEDGLGPSAAREASLDAAVRDALDHDVPLRELRKLVQVRLEERYLTKSLGAHGSVARAAAASGIAPRQFQRLALRARTSGADGVNGSSPEAIQERLRRGRPQGG